MNHVDRVRAYLRARAGSPNLDPEVIADYWRAGEQTQLTVADLDALCRDAERLRELEDL